MCGGEGCLPDLPFQQRIHTEGERTDAQKVQADQRGSGPGLTQRVGRPVEINPEVGGAVPREDANEFCVRFQKETNQKANIN